MVQSREQKEGRKRVRELSYRERLISNEVRRMKSHLAEKSYWNHYIADDENAALSELCEAREGVREALRKELGSTK